MYNEQIERTLPVLTHVVDDEAFALAENEPGRVWVEGDSQIGRGGEELERAAAANVPPQDASGELLAISDGYHVTVTDVQSGHGDTEKVRKCKNPLEMHNLVMTTIFIGFFFKCMPNIEKIYGIF